MKDTLENFILSEILNAPVQEDFLSWSGKRFIRNNKETSAAETQSLIASAKAISANDFWKAMISDLKAEGYRRIGNTAIDFEGVRYGKAILYILDVMEKKIAHASKLPVEQQS
jgi:hypothetical protein